MNELDTLIAIESLRATAQRLGSPVRVGAAHLAVLLNLPVETIVARIKLEAETEREFYHECGV